jgi:hypothetical protein
MAGAASRVNRVLLVFAGGSLLVLGCGDNGGGVSADALSRLMDDGDVAAVAPTAAAGAPAGMTAPPRFCSTGDCSGLPLAFWTLDDCNSLSTQLADFANTSEITHPAFRAVSAACVSSVDNQGIRLSGPDDVIYAPDQPDFLFNQGLTVAAWINPDNLNGTQSIFRKRLDGSSSFLLAIDGGKLTFALKLTNGKNVGITAAIKAKRFTHLAATYDGKQASLYVNGALAASTKVAGTIAPGAGPILVGNDANGREMVGTVDDIWLNTLAAPGSVVQGLSCIHSAPVVALTPGTTPAETAGATVAFDLAITNADSANCPADTFDIFPEVYFPVKAATSPAPVSVAPGATAHAPISLTTSKMLSAGSYQLAYIVESETAFQSQATAQATLVIGTGPVSCDGFPPSTPQITGSFASPVGGNPPLGLYTYAATGLVAPAVSALPSSDGTFQGLQVLANPGASTDLNNNYVGFGMGFDNPPCLDASAYTGVQFTVAGDLGTCNLQFNLVPSENNSAQYSPLGVCTGTSCFGPYSTTLGVGTTIVNFADMTGGMPLATLDATALNDIGWQLTVPTDGVTAQCAANFSVTNVSFTSAATPTPPPDGGVAGPGGANGGAAGGRGAAGRAGGGFGGAGGASGIRPPLGGAGGGPGGAL